jgi:hypothetical protein
MTTTIIVTYFINSMNLYPNTQVFDVFKKKITR